MGVATVVVARMLLSQCSSTSSVVTTSHLYIHPPSRGLVSHVMVLLEHAQASVLTPFTHLEHAAGPYASTVSNAGFRCLPARHDAHVREARRSTIPARYRHLSACQRKRRTGARSRPVSNQILQLLPLACRRSPRAQWALRPPVFLELLWT